MGEERAQTVLQPQLAVRHLQQCTVAAVAVEEQQTRHGRRGDAAADVVQHREEGLSGQPHRAGRPGVLVRLGETERGKEPRIMGLAVCLHRRTGDGVRHEEVSAER